MEMIAGAILYVGSMHAATSAKDCSTNTVFDILLAAGQYGGIALVIWGVIQ